MPRHTFVQQTKLSDVNGRIDYISNPERQEHLYAFCSSVEPIIWEILARQNQMEFKKSGANGKCIEARKLVIALPESLQNYDPEQLLREFMIAFQKEYPVPCAAAVHHNKSMTNYHIHLIFSEREILEEVKVKTATRAMFYNEEKKHVRTKKEILDENGNVRPGCVIIPKGEPYSITGFDVKNKDFKSKAFIRNVKVLFTELINDYVKDEHEKLQVFQEGGPYLATKKIGRNNPLENEIRADNQLRQEWNSVVDEAITIGIPEEKILQAKKETISIPIQESFRQNGFHPESLREIVLNAIRKLLSLIREMRIPVIEEIRSEFRLFESMIEIRKKLNTVVSQLRNLDRSIEILEQKLQKYTGITGAVKSSEKRKMISEKEALQDQRSVLSKQLGIIVRDAGYHDTRNFMDAYHRCEDTVREYHEWLETHPEEKKIAMESALDRLHRYQEQAKISKVDLKRYNERNVPER